MEGATEVLVIILSVFLAIFLILGIALTILLIRISRAIQRIADRAEGLVGNVESAATAFRNAAGPMAVGKFLVNIAEMVIKKKKGRG